MLNLTARFCSFKLGLDGPQRTSEGSSKVVNLVWLAKATALFSAPTVSSRPPFLGQLWRICIFPTPFVVRDSGGATHRLSKRERPYLL